MPDHRFADATAAEADAPSDQTEEEVYLEALTRIRDEEQGYGAVLTPAGSALLD